MTELLWNATWFIFGGCAGGLVACAQDRKWAETPLWIIGLGISVAAIGVQL